MNAQQLRNSILQLAIQGKLVPQDPNDEPASVLLEKAFSVKKKMISEKIVKADKLDTPVSEDEFVFELPNGWSWVRLNNVHIIARGGSPRPIKEYLTNAEDGVNWIKIGDTEKGGKYINSTQEKIKPSGVCHSRMIHKGDFLLTNSMSFGRPYISNVEGCIHDGWLVISPAYGIVFDQDYLYYLLSSPFTFDQFSGKVAGAVVQNLNSDKVATSVFPLPPLSEQRRIVAKLEELLPLVEQYGKAQDDLDALNADLPRRLRQSILQQAIQGKLVPQDPNDEPASVLLDRLKKNFLHNNRKINRGSKGNLEVNISDIEKPFDIPSTWVWCQVQDISSSYIGLTYSPSEVSNDGILVLRSSNIKGGKLDLIDQVRVKKEVSDKLLVRNNDILICARNGSKKLVGKSALISGINEPMTFGAFMAICKTPCYEYVYQFLQSAYFFAQLKEVSGTTTINQLTQNNFNSFLIPLPPLAEQHRIVAKIEQLFTEIDKLV